MKGRIQIVILLKQVLSIINIDYVRIKMEGEF